MMQRIGTIGDVKPIEQGYQIDFGDVISPGGSSAFRCLIGDEARSIKQASFLEVFLPGTLDFNNEFFTLKACTDQIKDGISFIQSVTQFLGGAVLQILYMLVPFQDCVEKSNQEIFIRFLAKQFLESEV